ncbi:MAG TPA: hypothetical protein PKJ68_04440 [Candidatus Woesebacteria bacterium]|nr:hypothetical protein [Candidatus Woesebacteria bacterium]
MNDPDMPDDIKEEAWRKLNDIISSPNHMKKKAKVNKLKKAVTAKAKKAVKKKK